MDNPQFKKEITDLLQCLSNHKLDARKKVWCFKSGYDLLLEDIVEYQNITQQLSQLLIKQENHVQNIKVIYFHNIPYQRFYQVLPCHHKCHVKEGHIHGDTIDMTCIK